MVNSAYFVKSNLQVLAMFQQLHIAGDILKALLAANLLFVDNFSFVLEMDPAID